MDAGRLGGVDAAHGSPGTDPALVAGRCRRRRPRASTRIVASADTDRNRRARHRILPV